MSGAWSRVRKMVMSGAWSRQARPLLTSQRMAGKEDVV